ncbi:MAG: hypothetical protein SV910_05800 [Chloroflexota bacterium]|nr:hypothetical protein [Chloroflexota bacterium]
MACISPDGKPTGSGLALLRVLKAGPRPPDEVAMETGRPVFAVRSGLRELEGAALVVRKGEDYELAPAAMEYVE